MCVDHGEVKKADKCEIGPCGKFFSDNFLNRLPFWWQYSYCPMRLAHMKLFFEVSGVFEIFLVDNFALFAYSLYLSTLSIKSFQSFIDEQRS